MGWGCPPAASTAPLRWSHGRTSSTPSTRRTPACGCGCTCATPDINGCRGPSRPLSWDCGHTCHLLATHALTPMERPLGHKPSSAPLWTGVSAVHKGGRRRAEPDRRQSPGVCLRTLCPCTELPLILLLQHQVPDDAPKPSACAAHRRSCSIRIGTPPTTSRQALDSGRHDHVCSSQCAADTAAFDMPQRCPAGNGAHMAGRPAEALLHLPAADHRCGCHGLSVH